MVPLITADYNLEGGVHFNSLKNRGVNKMDSLNKCRGKEREVVHIIKVSFNLNSKLYRNRLSFNIKNCF